MADLSSFVVRGDVRGYHGIKLSDVHATIAAPLSLSNLAIHLNCLRPQNSLLNLQRPRWNVCGDKAGNECLINSQLSTRVSSCMKEASLLQL